MNDVVSDVRAGGRAAAISHDHAGAGPGLVVVVNAVVVDHAARTAEVGPDPAAAVGDFVPVDEVALAGRHQDGRRPRRVDVGVGDDVVPGNVVVERPGVA